MRRYSVIVPVYNRPQEVKELLDSLALQSYKNFEVVLVEDGSIQPCEYLLSNYNSSLTIHYFFKANSGPGDSRNFGMDKAEGDYFIFFDSDCIIPAHYFETLEAHLNRYPLDAFGGPDSAHESFSDTQKAINQAMTSFITTGGIRGRKQQLDKFQPRSFNMGLSKEVYQNVGGFSDIHPGEDPDLSYRIMNAGYSTGLIPGAYVYHKRRIDFEKFYMQVNKFGMVRVILLKWYPDKAKAVYFLPALFVLGTTLLLLLSLFVHLSLTPLILLSIVIWAEAIVNTGNLKISLLAVVASYIQLFGYGWGFLKAYWEISMNGKNEREVFPQLFFKKN